MNDKRIAEVKYDGEWKQVSFSDIKKGDTFRLYDEYPDKPVIDARGSKEWIALSNPYSNKDGILTVDIDG
jgi:hypothetical protein